MTPEERKRVAELFDRLESLESSPRDPDAVAAINDGLARAPNALYPLVQTTLLQDEALKQADARIRDLEAKLGTAQPEQGGFLGGMRQTMSRPTHGSVPSIRPDAPSAHAPSGPWRTTSLPQGGPAASPAGYAQDQQAAGSGGSFLGTAAATAAGVVGGALLMNSLRGMFGNQAGGQGQGQSAFDSGSGGRSAWNSDAKSSDLAREAGLDDIGSSKRLGDGGQGGSERAGLFDSPQGDAQDFGWTGSDSEEDDGAGDGLESDDGGTE
jgi:uncharacterized protein